MLVTLELLSRGQKAVSPSQSWQPKHSTHAPRAVHVLLPWHLPLLGGSCLLCAWFQNFFYVPFGINHDFLNSLSGFEIFLCALSCAALKAFSHDLMPWPSSWINVLVHIRMSSCHTKMRPYSSLFCCILNTCPGFIVYKTISEGLKVAEKFHPVTTALPKELRERGLNCRGLQIHQQLKVNEKYHVIFKITNNPLKILTIYI